MATIRSTASDIRKGRVGNTSYYYLKGQQIARQSRNNSNYGPEARRSEAQQSRRVLWSNLVNLYKACSFWMPKAFESKTRAQSDYNAFMSKNISSSMVSLTKVQSEKGCAVVDSYVISQGSLPPIGTTGADAQNQLFTDIKVSSSAALEGTLGAFSSDVIAQNAGYVNGDNIAFVLFENWADGTEYPYAATRYFEITLDTASSAPLSDNPIMQLLELYSDGGTIGFGSYITQNPRPVGWASIHTRQDGSTLKVSSQSIVLIKPIIRDAFNTQLQKLAAMESYGVDPSVLLDPSFNGAVITSVSVNGSQIADFSGKTLSYSQAVELTITGKQLTDGVRLVHDGVEYTPLATTSDSLTYILGDNGLSTVYIGDAVAFRIKVDGVVVPDGLPSTLTMYQMPSSSIVGESTYGVNRQADANASCINYPHMVTEDYEFFLLLLPFTGLTRDDFVCVNCTIVNIGEDPRPLRVSLSVTDTAATAYITYQGFIIAVFNYS